MLWPLQMILSNHAPLYLSGYVEKEKRAYYEALQQAQKRLEYLPLIEFMCEAFHASYFEMENSRKALLYLPETWAKRARFRKGSAAQRSLDILIRSPILSIHDMATQLETSFQAASLAMEKLVEARIIRERTGKQRRRIFAAEEVIAVLSREFGSDPMDSIEFAQRKMDKIKGN